MLNYIRTITARRNDKGASAVEYGLLVAAVAAIIVLLVFAIGKFVKAGFQDTCNGFSTGASDTVKTAATC